MKKRLLILYHSQQGHTEKLAKACREGALMEKGVDVQLKRAFEVELKDIEEADGLIIATPEYFGYMSGAVKDFFDRTYYPSREKELQLPYCLLICCENDGSGAKRHIETIASGYILRKALETLIIREHELKDRINEAKELGQTFAAGLVLGIF
ncbi:MAG: flavodoxin [Chitinophagaceae bacterium]|nr:MAG: flavodoxin [Chitinophagaceae bacterium]